LFSRITKEFIRINTFRSDGLSFSSETKDIYFRPRRGIKLPPNAEENFAALKIKLLKLFQEHHKGDFVKLEVKCSISEAAMRKYLKGTRKITREAVAKFCIGTKLSVEQSKKLFTLQGHSLEPDTQLFDALVVNALQDGDDINIFFDTCKEYKINIF